MIKLIHELLDRKINDITIVLNAGNLDKKSKLRSLFEKDKNLICMPFYKDDSRTLIQLANNFFRNNKKNRLINQTILFSPSAASFDTFKNFEDRGYYFNKLVKKHLYGK